MPVIADTGPLYALIDSSDAWHERVTAWWRDRTQNVVVPAVVLPGVSYLLQTRIGPAAELAFIQAVADGEFTIEALEPEDIVRAAVLLRDYADLPLGFADAAVVAAAERLGAREILTTDRRHFSVIQPLHTNALVLLP
ncbi:MAG: type II toxin-antitoxin system VapC family toxin [Gemmatimonadaceae bacterium]